MAAITAVAGCGGSESTGDSGVTTSVRSSRTLPGTGAPAERSDAPATAADVATLRVGTVPGWESLIDPWLVAVGELSGGQFQAKLDYDWQDAHAGREIERDIVDAVASGDLDIGYIGSRAFNAFGVTDFESLTAPFLIDSYELQQAVLDSDMPEQMLASIDSLGLSGLALAAGELRYPLGVERPLTRSSDFAGITFHTFPSESNAATAEALGSTHVDMFGDERDDAIDAGTVDATENSLTWMHRNGRTAYATVNAPLWPAMGVLIANPDTIAGLAANQTAALQRAIGEALPTTAELAGADVALVAELCAAGKRLESATADDLAGLRAAVDPVYELLAADPVTASYLDEIQSLKSTVGSDPIDVPDVCTRTPVTAAPAVVEGTEDPSVLDGSYQLEWSVDEMVAAGADEKTARRNAGRYVVTFDDGEFDQTWDEQPGVHCPGTYTVSENRVVMTSAATVADWDCGGDSVGMVIVDAAWKLDSDQLVLSDFVQSSVPDITAWNAGYLGKPLVRIG